MPSDSSSIAPPVWMDGALVVRCAMCIPHPGAKYQDGSGVCPACTGAAWKVLAQKPTPVVVAPGRSTPTGVTPYTRPENICDAKP